MEQNTQFVEKKPRNKKIFFIVGFLLLIIGILTILFKKDISYTIVNLIYNNEIQEIEIQNPDLSNVNQNNQSLPDATAVSDSSSVFDCGDDDSCLYEKIKIGKVAKIVLTQKVESMSLEEKSEVKINPENVGFKVYITLLNLRKIAVKEVLTKSIVSSVAKTCPKILNDENLNRLNLSKAYCIVPTAEEARKLAVEGLSENTIKKYSCSGDLIDKVKSICSSSTGMPEFPPGFKKPAVYLYPENDSKVKVSLKLNGFLTKSEPFYENGWKVFVTKNGIIDGKYDYLFYESQLNDFELPNEGWVVKYNDLSNWFNENLSKLGLNEKESTQFKEYWLLELPKSNFYEIRLFEQNFLKKNMDLVVEPKPTTMIRLNFYFKPLVQNVVLREPIIVTPERKGFTVVEWGGALDK